MEEITRVYAQVYLNSASQHFMSKIQFSISFHQKRRDEHCASLLIFQSEPLPFLCHPEIAAFQRATCTRLLKKPQTVPADTAKSPHEPITNGSNFSELENILLKTSCYCEGVTHK